MVDIIGYEGLYAVTETGEVWSHRLQRFLSPCKHKLGYWHIPLMKDGQRKHKFIHRLVAEAFIPNPQGLSDVNHRDECKDNNYVDNLEWVSHKENCNYGSRNQKISEAVRK